MKRRLRGLLLALVVGVVLVGLVALLVRVSDFDHFFKACLWAGVVVLFLAFGTLVTLSQSPLRVERRPGGEPDCRESYSAPVVGVSDAERRSMLWATLYVAGAAVPCLLTAALHALV